MNKRDLLKKHKFAIDCAIKYYVKNQPTGISDYYYDQLEKDALNDGISIRDIALSKIKGNRIKNQYIESFQKDYSGDSIYDSIIKFINDNRLFDAYIEPKYDGSGVAAYYEDGILSSIVTCGGSNKSSDEGGIDQTMKLMKYLPIVDPDIKAIQCEVLVPMDFCDRPRQLSNGIINSKNKYSESDIDNMVCIRGLRVFRDNKIDFMKSMMSLDPCINPNTGLYNFSPGYIMDINEFKRKGKDIIDREFIETPTGNFLIDGYVLYTKYGDVIKAFKFKNAGGQEGSEVEKIQWNDLSSTKDGFSSNVILKDPVDIKGSLVKKPSSNGVSNLLRNNISKGAIVSVTLRGSTIPCVDKVFKPGNGDFNWPVCKCGTQLGPNDIFRNNLKCPNPYCTSRINRMIEYLNLGRFNIDNLSTYNGLFIIDGYKFENKIPLNIDPLEFSRRFTEVLSVPDNLNEFTRLFIRYSSFTRLQERNFLLVAPAAYYSLTNYMNL